MRGRIAAQPGLAPVQIEHEHAGELEEISEILDEVPEVLAMVHADVLPADVDPETGRPGMTADQVLRALVVKQTKSYSYKELAFHIEDSTTIRRFCRYGVMDKTPSDSALQANVSLISAETLEQVNRAVLGIAESDGIETGRKVRVDCAVVESNIHAPTDSSLLWDSVRTLARLLADAQEFDVTFPDHRRRAKRRALGIMNAKSPKQRTRLYRDLLKVARKTVGYARDAIACLPNAEASDLMASLRLSWLVVELRHFAGLAERVIDQTTRRVINGEKVPASEKLVSIFETHTDIIIKDRREVEYGHKICVAGGTSSMILDCVIPDGNPADSTLATPMIDRQVDIYGRPPRQAAFDGGFASRANVDAIKKRGVKDVAFHKRRGIKVHDMVKSTWVYRSLRRFRAGIEGVLSFLSRCFGLARCTWKGLAHFKSYVWGSVVSANLLILARHRLARAAPSV